jgi:hypothetical protein
MSDTSPRAGLGRLAVTDCIEGCVVRGKHLPTCQDDTCLGCLPRPAEFGLTCPWTWQRLNADIVDCPALVRYLWAVAHSGTTTTTELKIRGGDPAERAVISPAIDALDDLHACLASWARLILDKHPDGNRMTGPDERCTWTTGWSPSKVLDCDERAEPYHVGPTIAGIRNPHATSRLVHWLLPLLPWCAQQDWVGEMRREIGDVVRTTAARYPTTERTRAIPGVTCPACERVSLMYDPATPERHTAQVNCSTRGCGVIFTEDEFRRLTRIIEWEHNKETNRP